MDTLSRIASFCGRHSLLGGVVACAVSGGPDSVALLHALRALCESGTFDFRLTACHVEHGIRGADSVADMEFVKKICEEWQIPLAILRVDVPKLAEQTGKGLETAARDARRLFFAKLLKDGTDRIALGHHRDDQAETVLMRLSRGARGALGMQPEADGLIRPLLCVSRKEIMAYLSENSLPYRTDRTNELPDNPRNKIRIHVLPRLQEAYPGAAAALARAAEDMRGDDDFLRRLAVDWLDGTRENLPDNAVLRRAVTEQAHRAGRDDCLTHTLIDRVTALYREGRTGERVAANGVVWEREKDGRVSLLAGDALTGETELAIPGTTDAAGYIFRASLHREWTKPLPDGTVSQVFDADRLPLLVVRARRPGDRMHPLGMKGSRKLQDILTDRGVPRALRDATPLLAHGSDVYWMPGLPPDERAKVRPDTKRYLWVQYEAYDHKGGDFHEPAGEDI